jgi:hypothetical protein
LKVKKLLVLFATIVALFSAGALSASAAYVIKDYTHYNFTNSYTVLESGGAQKREYTPGTFLSNAWVRTGTSLSADRRGYSHALIIAINGKSGSASTSDKVSVGTGWLTTGSASVSGQNYAKDTYHYSKRYDVSGNLLDTYRTYVFSGAATPHD